VKYQWLEKDIVAVVLLHEAGKIAPHKVRHLFSPGLHNGRELMLRTERRGLPLENSSTQAYSSLEVGSIVVHELFKALAGGLASENMNAMALEAPHRMRLP